MADYNLYDCIDPENIKEENSLSCLSENNLQFYKSGENSEVDLDINAVYIKEELSPSQPEFNIKEELDDTQSELNEETNQEYPPLDSSEFLDISIVKNEEELVQQFPSTSMEFEGADMAPRFKEEFPNTEATDIQRGWKSLRDSFRRELAATKKKKSGSGRKSRREEYAYLKQHSFLLQICKTGPNKDEVTEDLTEGRNAEKGSQLCVSSNHQIKKKKPVISDEQVLFQALLKKAIAPDDPDEQFLLSLLPDFKCIHENTKLDAKIEVMNILKRYKQHPTLTNQHYFSL